MNNNEKALYDFVEKIFRASSDFLAEYSFDNYEKQLPTERIKDEVLDNSQWITARGIASRILDKQIFLESGRFVDLQGNDINEEVKRILDGVYSAKEILEHKYLSPRKLVYVLDDKLNEVITNWKNGIELPDYKQVARVNEIIKKYNLDSKPKTFDKQGYRQYIEEHEQIEKDLERLHNTIPKIVEYVDLDWIAEQIIGFSRSEIKIHKPSVVLTDVNKYINKIKTDISKWKKCRGIEFKKENGLRFANNEKLIELMEDYVEKNQINPPTIRQIHTMSVLEKNLNIDIPFDKKEYWKFINQNNYLLAKENSIQYEVEKQK